MSSPWWPEAREGDLVRYLSEEQYRRLLSAMKTWTAEPGELVLRKGDASLTLILVTEGELEVVDAEVVLARIGAGGVVGEVGFVDGHPRTHDVRAVDRPRLWSLTRTSLLGLGREDPALLARVNLAVAELLAIRFRSVVEDLRTIRSFAAPAGQAQLFDELADTLPPSSLARPALEAIRNVAQRPGKQVAGV